MYLKLNRHVESSLLTVSKNGLQSVDTILEIRVCHLYITEVLVSVDHVDHLYHVFRLRGCPSLAFHVDRPNVQEEGLDRRHEGLLLCHRYRAVGHLVHAPRAEPYTRLVLKEAPDRLHVWGEIHGRLFPIEGRDHHDL